MACNGDTFTYAFVCLPTLKLYLYLSIYWRKLHNGELPNIIRNIKSRRLGWAGHVARKELSRNAYRILVGKSEGKRPLGKPRRRWEDNTKMDLKEAVVGLPPVQFLAGLYWNSIHCPGSREKGAWTLFCPALS